MSTHAPMPAPIVPAPAFELPSGYPGHDDAAYLTHRAVIAEAAHGHLPGAEPPHIAYTPQDHACWNQITHALAPLWRKYATAEVREAMEGLALPTDRVPQLAESSRRLRELTGFSFAPAAGIVPLQDFYGTLADSVFQSTQFIRHYASPLFSPEPDMVHEVLGHGATLASPRFADLYRQFGAAARRAETRESLKAVSRVFWFTLEYGLLGDPGSPMAYGASLLSSYGELQQFRQAYICPLDVRRMVTVPYDVTEYQSVLFAAYAFEELEDFVGAFCAGVDGDTGDRLGVTADQRW